ncbi:MAG: hypothetical protein ACYCYI_03435 [Saccharofermentanales bacterium]
MSGFKYKVAYGAWINDMRNEPMLGQGWPGMTLDEQAEKDIIGSIDLQSKAGFNIFEVWGLLVTFSWPMDIKSASDADRKLRINRIIKAAHDRGMKLITGLGVYSWGFDEIIKNCPGVSGPNPHAMCGSKDESWEWMKKILDFVLTEYDNLDGIHIESADLGRCSCDACAKINDIEYHAKIDIRVSDYIKEKFPEKLVMATTCGFKALETEQEIGYIIELSKHIDYLIMPGFWHTKEFMDKEKRVKFMRDLHCAFGSSAGNWVYPPQRWDRLKWFLPYTKKTGEHIKQLYEEGGNAVEYYMGPAINPGVELNIAFGGRMLSQPERSTDDVLFDVLYELYKPDSDETCHKLAKIFLDAEAAYYDNSSSKHNELRLTHLWGTEPGPECYISTYDEHNANWVLMDYKARASYKNGLVAVLNEIPAIENNVGEPEKIERVKTCIENVIKDLDKLGITE